MAKRVGNVLTVADLRNEKVSGAAARHLVFTTHYRKELNLTDAGLIDSKRAVGRIRELADRLEAPTTLGGTTAMRDAADALKSSVRDALFDDLNAPQALAAVFDFVHAANADLDRRASDRSALDEAASALEFIEATLGIVPPVRLGGATVPVQGVKATPEVGTLHVAIVNDETRQETALREFVEEQIRARQAARGRRDFATADAIRAELEAKGIALADSGAGTSWKVVK